jgi:hypothetical protein
MIAAVDSCPNCRAQTSCEDVFCQDCGFRLEKQEVSAYSLLEDEGAKEPSFSIERLSPSKARPVVALPVVVLLVSLCGLIIWAVFGGIERIYSSLSSGYIVDQARSLLNAQHAQAAVEILQRQSLARRGALSPDERALFDCALLKVAEENAAAHNYMQAISQLSLVSANCPQRNVVQDRLVEYKALQAAQSKAATVLAAATAKVRHLPSAAVPSAPVRTPAARAAAVAPATKTSVDSIAATPRAVKEQAPEPLAEEEARAKPAAPQQGDEPVKRSALVKPEVKYAESDVVRYNELLAGYFSSSTAKSSGKAGAERPGEMREPPSLKEWIDLGKPHF